MVFVVVIDSSEVDFSDSPDLSACLKLAALHKMFKEKMALWFLHSKRFVER
jgi:hypothetical protein